jgi:pyruvate dehydrogenase E2 component (dihydrolipoamide acetyltransferase)
MTQSQTASEVILPSMGEGIVEATVVKWLRKAGDDVNKGDPLVEVSTDKVDTEIPSPFSGKVLKLIAQEGSTVEVNSLIGWIGPEGANIPESSTAKASRPTNQPTVQKKSNIAKPQTSSAYSGKESTLKTSPPAGQTNHDFSGSLTLRTSPLVRKMTKELGLDVRRIPGTGLGGRITKADVEAFAESPQAWQDDASLEMIDRPLLSKVSTTQIEGREALEGVIVRREKMTKIRRLIAEHMVESVRVSPHVTTTFEIDLSNVTRDREAKKTSFQKEHGVNLTYTHYFIKAAVDAIKEHPIVNVSVDGDEILWKDQINIGCAVALGASGGGGLIVPVIKDAGKMNLTDIALKLSDLATRARAKKLAADEVIGGTFSITNPGGWGSVLSNPIINQPQVAMLAVGAVVKRPIVDANDQIVIRPMMLASLTFDHRVIDGEGGAMWLATFKQILESDRE